MGTCYFPALTLQFAVIAREYANLGAHLINRGVSVGTELIDSAPEGFSTVKGRSYVQAVKGTAKFNWVSEAGGTTVASFRRVRALSFLFIPRPQPLPATPHAETVAHVIATGCRSLLRRGHALHLP